MTDAQGNWPTWNEFWEGVENFINDVIIDSVILYAGVGVGIGLPFQVVEVTTNAELGVLFENGEWTVGEFGENSVSVNAGFLSVKYAYSGGEDSNGNVIEWNDDFDIKLSIPFKGPGSFGASCHYEASISLISLYNNFVSFGKENWGW